MYGVFGQCPVSVVIAVRIMYVGVLSVWSSPVGLCMGVRSVSSQCGHRRSDYVCLGQCGHCR